jgi:hypothetical protein
LTDARTRKKYKIKKTGGSLMHNFEFERIAFCIAAEAFAVGAILFVYMIIVVRNQAREERDDRRKNGEPQSTP